MRDLLRRRAGVTVAVLVVLVLLFGNRIATFLTDLWWFDAVGYRGVFTGLLFAKILLGAIGAVLMAVLVAVNLQIARRLRPVILPATPQQAIVERYRQMAEPWLKWIIAAVAILFGIASGASLSIEWEAFLLWQHGGDFGVADPQFGRDVGFFVFDLPFQQALQEWLQFSVLVIGMLAAGAHYLLGAIRPELPRDRVLPGARAHLSILLVAFLLVRGWGYWLDRFALNFSPRGQVTGASYTDVNAELPALNLLLVVTVVAIALILWSLRQQGFLLPGAAIGLLVVGTIILQGIYPAAIQRFRVDPQELAQEREFIERNLEFTRAAWGLDEVDLQQFAVTNDLSAEDVANQQTTIDNVRLWDPNILETTYEELQALRPYYEFLDVDVDRYVIDGQLRQVMLGARELEFAGLDATAQTWQNERLTFTHGLGVVASQVNVADDEGQPVFLAEDIPPTGESELVANERPGIYYGELVRPSYSIVRTDERELDYEQPGTLEQVTTVYDGEGGVVLGGRLRRLAWALRFSDTNFILSSLLRDDSRVIMHRNIQDRIRTVAPYLFLDADPYPVILGGRTLWVQDAYTASANYPYSQRVDVNGTSINYIRNSVKAVVDAYDGTVTLYVADDEDPIINAWRKAFPDGYADLADAPDGLAEHFRYPETLFLLQARRYLTYHIPGAEAFYSKADEWQIPLDPSASASGGSTQLLEPFYLLMTLPGETEAEFVLIQPYLAKGKQNMVAWLAARSDPEHYGELLGVQFPSTQTILGPSQAQARIEQEDAIAEYTTLRGQAGSNVIRGNLLVLPIADSILYVEPFFLDSPQARIPELDRVVIVMGSRVAFEPTLEEALASLLAGAPPGEGEPEPSEDPDVLEERALELFDQANEARRRGELGEFERLFDRALALLQRAAELRGLDVPTDEPTGGPTEGPTESSSPAAEQVSTG
ncbi:MAG: UPF0182 family protein [Nitriliruptorales bacterium]|nr:UPF0182 family protein [Nitriliruptorales bacterium]